MFRDGPLCAQDIVVRGEVPVHVFKFADQILLGELRLGFRIQDRREHDREVLVQVGRDEIQPLQSFVALPAAEGRKQIAVRNCCRLPESRERLTIQRPTPGILFPFREHEFRLNQHRR